MATKKGDFVELKFAGYANGELFDSNIEEELKKLNPESKPQKTIVVIGERMVVPGLDDSLEGKEFEKEYEVDVPAKDGFGPRHRELIKVIPLKMFHAQKIDPHPGMSFVIDNQAVKVIAVSGARVTTDFNNPLAGKDLHYRFTITRQITEPRDKAESIFNTFWRFAPEFDVSETTVTVKGPKNFELFVGAYKEKFNELVGLELAFMEVKPEKKETSAEKADAPESKE
jgi:FKBP-type peptidyl-prolyl cis-trans isomerase 2